MTDNNLSTPFSLNVFLWTVGQSISLHDSPIIVKFCLGMHYMHVLTFTEGISIWFLNSLDPIRPLLRCRPLPHPPGSGFWIALVVNRIQKWRHLLENSALFPSGKLTQFAVNYGIYWHSFLFENFLCSEF